MLGARDGANKDLADDEDVAVSRTPRFEAAEAVASRLPTKPVAASTTPPTMLESTFRLGASLVTAATSLIAPDCIALIVSIESLSRIAAATSPTAPTKLERSTEGIDAFSSMASGLCKWRSTTITGHSSLCDNSPPRHIEGNR